MKRIYGLDILRAAAILLVIYSHSNLFITGWDNPFTLLNGVSVFFVLSGFLIGGILFKTINKKFDFRELVLFWKRRWLRTLPAYYFVLTGIIVVTHSHSYGHFIFIQNIFTAKNLNFYAESWSLSVEEWFYLTIPVLFFLILKFFNKKYLLIPIISIIVFGVMYRIFGVNHSMTQKDYWNVCRFSVVSRIDCIMWGILAAYLNAYSANIWNKLKKLSLVGVIILAVIIVYQNYIPFNISYAWVLPLMESASVFMIIPYLSTVKTGKGVLYSSFTFISKISYSMYLLNESPASTFLNFYRMRQLAKTYHWLPFVTFILFSFVGAYLLYICVEKPFMKLRDKKDSKKDSNLLSKVGKVENTVIINQ